MRAVPPGGDVACEIAPDVLCIGPHGRTQTNVYLVRSGADWVLVDTGWAHDADRIRRATASVTGSRAPTGILLTHCHPDHCGAARALAETWDCPVYMTPAELGVATGDFAAMVATQGPLDRFLLLPALRALGEKRRSAVLARGSLGDRAHSFEAGGAAPGLADWVSVPTTGHTRGHVAYFRPSDRVLIAGDAVSTLHIRTVTGLLRQRPGLSDPPWYTTWDGARVHDSITRLAELAPAVLGGGHGQPLTGPETPDALRAFAAAPGSIL